MKPILTLIWKSDAEVACGHLSNGYMESHVAYLTYLTVKINNCYEIDPICKLGGLNLIIKNFRSKSDP